jgi:SAM-dependent methyltransferase
MKPPEQPAANFDPVARSYRWMEYLSFGRSLMHCRNYFLPQLVSCRSALLLGDGDGRFLARLLVTNPGITADVVDTSAAMLRLLKRRANSSVGDAGTRLRIHHLSALTFSPERIYDLIVTHFFLDCLTQSEVDGLTVHLAKYMHPGGLWLVSEFRIPRGAMRWPSRFTIWLLYLGFRLITGLRTNALPDHAGSLAAAGFTLIGRQLWLGGLLSSEIWEYTPCHAASAKAEDRHHSRSRPRS